MPSYTPPVRDMQFVLHDVLGAAESDIPGYGELDRDFTAAVLDEAGKLATEVLLPLNAVGDAEGCRLETTWCARPPASGTPTTGCATAAGWGWTPTPPMAARACRSC